MQIDDRLLGLLLVAFGVAVFLVAQTFPMMAGLAYGPDFFPSIAAVGMIVCGALIAVSGVVRARAVTPPAAAAPPPAARFGAGLARPAILCLVVIAFAVLLGPLGFHIAALLAVGAAALTFGAHPLTAATLAVVASIAVHAVFYSLLRVPLPWGVLTPYAW
ncbi:tripartite tricarboxylate transporter TctB family protein [Acuticoccus mangrovi]|uniref:Tripartite tricarboxylate transporter TctB family protein n=1 Tax=Acuticoccus mangrovi TaxID=2796142 RepID=A0A934II43_9HYPH|nr:tripartite tricarboxylate transporter TctB family protein [Acuticoccus mangrovi]MBJ3774137.1 tripartite tricarboxylate transporter TctB family protein [Acuticoccus mangrovi]